jgi:hypothetical protein
LRFGRNIEKNETDTGNGIRTKKNINPHVYCINEFGKQIDEKHYGTNIQQAINSMLMIRYELFQNNGILTHATSNFHPSELKCFDDALLDRFSEMFNFVPVDGVSYR